MKDERFETWNPELPKPVEQSPRQVNNFEYNGDVNTLHQPNPSWMDKAANLRPH